MEEVDRNHNIELEIKAFHGRDGQVIWTWKGGPERWVGNRPWPMLELADLRGDGTRRICVQFTDSGANRRIVVLDPTWQGKRARDLSVDTNSILKTIDLDAETDVTRFSSPPVSGFTPGGTI